MTSDRHYVRDAQPPNAPHPRTGSLVRASAETDAAGAVDEGRDRRRSRAVFVIALDGVSKTLDGKRVLHPTRLFVRSGETLALVGPSGCGKSTILRLVCGLLVPDAGHVRVDGMIVTPKTVQAVRRRIGYVVQAGGLFPHLTAGDNVALLARHLRWSPPRIASRLEALARLVRVDERLLGRYSAQLSGGEQQRVGIMRALMLDPPVLLMDEPMGALDPIVRARLREDLKQIFLDWGKTVLLVTHDLDEAAYLGTHVALMRSGQVVQQGTMRQLVLAPADPFVREFIEARPPCA
jgi:osmoprotectant transport system ATP-binding protein